MYLNFLNFNFNILEQGPIVTEYFCVTGNYIIEI